MILDKVANSHNDEYYTPSYAIEPLLKYLPNPPYTIWCPFDTPESNFVKEFIKQGYEVIATHIKTGQDFFTEPMPECDAIISNPPYSLKTEVLQRLFDIGKPFAMLVGVVGLFESQKRFNMFKNNKFELLYFNLRVSYLKEQNDTIPAINPPFSSVYVCHNILPCQICFERIQKRGKNERLS